MIRIMLLGPDGAEYDITSLTLQRGLETINQDLEEDLLQLKHGDVGITCRNADGFFSKLFQGAKRGDRWIISIESDEWKNWRKLFSGVLDFPLSVRFDDKERRVSMQFYALSKLLEFSSAEAVKRLIVGITGTINSGSKVMSVTATSQLVSGDSITLQSAVQTETFIIESIVNATDLTVRTAAANTFSAAVLMLDTPFYRSQSVSFLAKKLFALGGITDSVIDIGQALQSTPFPSSLNTSGLTGGLPAAVLERSTNIAVYQGGNRYDATSPSSGFGAPSVDTAKIDWRPYKATEPATLRAANVSDDGSRAPDYDTGDYFELRLNVNESLELWKNGSFALLVATGGAPPNFSNRWDYGLDFNEATNEVWVSFSYMRFNNISDAATLAIAKTNVYSTAPALLYQIDRGGRARNLAGLGLMAVLPYTVSLQIADSEFVPQDDQPVHLYSGSTLVRTIDQVSGLILWTLREMGSFLLCLRQTTTTTSCVIWDKSSGSLLAILDLVDSVSTRNLATVWNDGGATDNYYVCYAAGTWFVISTVFSGTIPYADFEGLSAAAALRELAVVSAAHFFVDNEGTGFIVGRKSSSLDSGDIRDIPEPIGSPVRMLASEWMRTSVQVDAKDEAGKEISVIAGDRGDSALRLSVSIRIPMTTSLAGTIANAYWFYLSKLGEQREEMVRIPKDGPLELLGRVSRFGKIFRILRVSTDLIRRIQELQIVEEG